MVSPREDTISSSVNIFLAYPVKQSTATSALIRSNEYELKYLTHFKKLASIIVKAKAKGS